ncbi:MAG: hypothetical protein HYT64_02265 [Candidatus Yanofskybacteria bacterium]|nr:hypothetical protein [Candidatus Yanofskybacteria bacterium]
MNKLQKIGYISATAAVLLMPVLVFAALPNPVPPVSGSAITLSEIEARITQVAQFLIIVGVVLAVIFIIWGGIAYMAAGGVEDKTTAARDRIKNGIIGAGVVLAVGVVLQTVAGLVARTFFS